MVLTHPQWPHKPTAFAKSLTPAPLISRGAPSVARCCRCTPFVIISCGLWHMAWTGANHEILSKSPNSPWPRSPPSPNPLPCLSAMPHSAMNSNHKLVELPTGKQRTSQATPKQVQHFKGLLPVDLFSSPSTSVIEQQDWVMTWCMQDGYRVHAIIIVFIWRQIMIFILGWVLFNYVLNTLGWVPLFPTVVDKGGDGNMWSTVFSGPFQSVLETVMYIIHALLRRSPEAGWQSPI